MKSSRRSYVMKARADAAAATREAILDAARAMLLTHSFDAITIDAVAARAGTTGRTVLRAFAGKEGLLEEALRTLGIAGRLPAAPSDIAGFLESVFDMYERIGDAVIRWLADELRLPVMRERLAFGRAALRAHLAYMDSLLTDRTWLAGESISLADIAAGAVLSVLDYIGEAPWDEAGPTRLWYAKLKSRPCFRSLLSDRYLGLPPAAHYDDLDF